MSSTFYYYDEVKERMVEGFRPNPNVKYGDAPYVIGDTIDAYYHPAAEMYVDSKSALRAMDKACGTITTDKKIPPNPSAAKERAKARRADIHKSIHAAVAQLKAGTAPLTEERRASLRQHDEAIQHAIRNGIKTEQNIIRADYKDGKQ